MKKFWSLGVVLALLGALPAFAYVPGFQVTDGSAGDDTPNGHAVLGDASIAFLATTPDAGAFGVSSCTACSSPAIVVRRIRGTRNGGGTIWSKGFGLAGGARGISLAAAPDGMLYILAKRGDGTPVVLKIKATTGALVSQIVFGTAATQATSITVGLKDAMIYIGGHFTGKTPDGCRASKGLNDAFICKVRRSDLAILSCGAVGSAKDETTLAGASNVCTDMHGDAYLVGTTGGWLGGANSGRTDAFIAKFDSNSNLVFVKPFGTAAKDVGVACAFDVYIDRLYLLGRTDAKLGQRHFGSTDTFLAQLSHTSGAKLWVYQYGSPGADVAVDLTIFNSRLFFTATVPSAESTIVTPYWTLDDPACPKNPATGNLRLWYNSVPRGGNTDIAVCEVAQVGPPAAVDPDYPVWSVPIGMAKWCSIFGSDSDDVAGNIRISPTYDAIFTGAVRGQYVENTGPAGTPQGGSDVSVELYNEYEVQDWVKPAVKNAPSTPKARTCPAKAH